MQLESVKQGVYGQWDLMKYAVNANLDLWHPLNKIGIK